MNKIDLIFLTHNRLAFVEQSWFSLIKNTNWSLVDSFLIYEDNSTDGTREFIQKEVLNFKGRVSILYSHLQYPVAIMNHFLSLQSYRQPIFAKIDSDVIVPPGWLDQCLATMDKNSKLDILGIEPTWSRTQAPWQGHSPAIIDLDEVEGDVSGFIPCAAIGGIGLMRKSCFSTNAAMTPHSKYGGFTDWQWRNKDIVKGWAAPALKLFLLDRMPMNPWKNLSLEYIANKWQRAWTDYTDDISHLWDWWQPVITDTLKRTTFKANMPVSLRSQ
jgi:hypothetical protein